MTTDRPPACGSTENGAVCSAVLEASFDQSAWQQVATSCKALADPTRLHLLALIAASPGCEACICHLTGPVGLSQPTVSHHMKLLTEAGLVTRQQRGKWAFYALVPAAFENLAAGIVHIGHPEA